MLMTKILLVPDIHFGSQENNDDFLDYQFTCIDWMYNVAREHNIENIIFLGDIFDKRRTINLRILDKIYKEFGFSEFNHYFILGNHDAYYKNCNDINSLSVLMKDHIIIDQEPVELEFDNTKLLLTPWINKENYDNCISKIEKSKAPYLLGHFDLPGFELIRGFLSDHASIPVKLLDKFDRVISGHYHCHSNKKHIHYLGSLCQLNWSDYSEKKFIGILTPSTNEFELIENPHRFYEIIRIKSEQDLDIDIESIKKKKVKIYLYVDRNIKIEKFITTITDYASSVVVIDEKVLNSTEYTGDLDVSKMSIIDSWKAYVDELEMSNKDKTIINKIFVDTYNQVSSGDFEEIHEI